MSIQQSPQGLAALTVGKPEILQQRIQQSGQNQQTGLPNDLVSALALSINMTEADAAKRDAALQELQQAAGPNGQMPTVLQSLQEQAKQKLQAQAAAQQPNPQQEAMQQAMQQQAMQQQAMQQQAMQQQAMQQRPGIDQLPAEFNMAGGGIVAFEGGGGVDLAEIRSQLNANPGDAALRSALPEGAYDPAEATRRSDFQQGERAYSSLPEKLMYEAMLKDKEAEADAKRQRLARELGPVDLSQYDRLIAEYDARKKQLEAPKEGYDAFMQYMKDIAGGGRGRKWYEAGAQGAAIGEKREKENQQQMFDLTKQGIEIAQKRNDAERAWKEKLYTVYETELTRVGDNAYNAAIAQGKTEADAEKVRQEVIQKELDRKSQELIAANRDKTQLAVASAPGATERMTARIMALEAKGTPEALEQARKLKETYQAVSGSTAGASAAKTLIRSIQADLGIQKALIAPGSGATPEQKEAARAQIAKLQERLNTLNGIDQEDSGAPRTAPPPPPGFKRQ